MLLAFHGEEEALGHLGGATVKGGFALDTGDPFADVAAGGLGEGFGEVEEIAVTFEGVEELGREVGGAVFEVGLDGEVGL